MGVATLGLATIIACGPMARAAGSAHEDRSSGNTAPRSATLTAADVSAIKKEIAAHRGAPLLLNFWAVWCEPCVAELPDLAKLESRFASSGVRVIGINCDLLVEDDSDGVRGKVLQTLRTAGVGYPNLLFKGTQDSLVASLGLPGALPFSILLDAEGKERKRWTGSLPITEVGAELAHVSRR